LDRVCNTVNCIDNAKAPSDHVSIAAAIAEDFPDGSAAWISAGDVERMLRATEGRSTSQAGLTTKNLNAFATNTRIVFLGNVICLQHLIVHDH